MRNKIFYGWWVVLACFLISFYVSSILYVGFTAFFEPLAREFGWSYTQISLASSLRGLEMGIFAPLVGILVDRFGSRKLMLCGSLAVGLGFIILSGTHSLAMFYGSFLLIAFGAGGCASVVTLAAVANWFEKKVGKAMGLMASGIGFSGLMVPVIVWMIERYQWRTTLIILGVGMWLLGLPLSILLRHRPESYGCFPDGRDSAAPPPREDPRETPPWRIRDALKNKPFLYLNIIEAMRMTVVTSVVTHIMPYLGSVGFSRSSAALIAGGIPLLSIIGRLGFGWLADMFQKRYVMFLGFCSMAAGMLALSQAHLRWPVFLFLVLLPPAFGGTMVLRGAILREYFGRDSFGRLLGFLMGSASIGGIVGPTLAGLSYDTSGSYVWIWLGFAGFLLPAASLALRLQFSRSIPGWLPPR